MPRVPILRAVFCNIQGDVLWREEPYQFSRMSGVGEFMVQNSVPFVVRRVAACQGTMYVNLEQQEKLGDRMGKKALRQPSPLSDFAVR